MRKYASMSAEEFEIEVMKRIEDTGNLLHAFRVSHREKLNGVDGDYEIDIVARFESLGVHFTVLIECKHHKHPIKREVVQILYDRIRSTGAHKGIIFSTAQFQKGAVNYAKTHGIALFWVSEEEIGPLAYSSGTVSKESEQKIKQIFSAMSRHYELLIFSEADGASLNELNPDEFRAMLGFTEKREMLPP